MAQLSGSGYQRRSAAAEVTRLRESQDAPHGSQDPGTPGVGSSREPTEQALAAALAQKEVLFRELSHRVVNGLQTVVSMIRLQRPRTNDPVAHDILASIENRVHAMALVHRRLYAADQHGSVNMAAYLSGLSEDLRSALGSACRNLCWTLDPDVTMASHRAIPLGLLTAELVTNACKHAHPEGRAGTITIELVHEAGQCALAVSDDGIGLPESFDPEDSEGLGMVIVRSQVQQLGGHLAYVRLSPGTRFTVTFSA